MRHLLSRRRHSFSLRLYQHKEHALSRMVYWLLGILLVAGVVYLFLPKSVTDKYITLPKDMFGKKQEYATSGPLNLQSSPIVAKTDITQKVLLETNTGSLQFFVHPLPFQRTGMVTACSGNTSQTAQPGDPNCTTARYGLCLCTGTDCSPCVHKGFVNLINLSNVVRLEILAVPDAGRQDSAAAQLVVRCKRPHSDGTTQETVEESLVLPNVPFQKWTMITIAREGRRFDIFYNDKLVMSKRTQHVIDTTLATGQIVAGDPMLYGQIGFVQAFEQKLTTPEVQSLYAGQADTTGQPSLPAPTKDFAAMFSMCKDGSCLEGPAFRPASALLDWDTNYA